MIKLKDWAWDAACEFMESNLARDGDLFDDLAEQLAGALRKAYDQGLRDALEAKQSKQDTAKREHVLEPCDQTVQCTVCLHTDWMDDNIPDECPGPPPTAHEHEDSNG